MRESVAKAVAVATGLLVVAAVVLFAVLQQEPRVVEPAVEGRPEVAEPEVERPDVEERPAVDRPEVEELREEVDVQEIPQEQLALGRRVYREQRCARCHSIAGEGSPRSPLDGVGDRLTREEIRLWIVAPQEIAPRVRKPSYDLPDEELEALVAYMASLTAME